MSQSIEPTSENIEQVNPDQCFCDKQKCLIGIASITIGIGGFVLANLL